MPTVTVIIPSFNNSRYVIDAIQSILNQTCPAKEIIVVDDGSQDNTREVLSPFFDQIHYIWQENRGLAGARNTGILAARGDYIGLLDADDMWQPDFLEKMLALAGSHPEGAVFYCQARCIDADKNGLQRVVGGPAIYPLDLYQTLLRANFLIPSTILMRRSTFQEVGVFDPGLRSCEDFDLWIRILRAAPHQNFIGTNDCLCLYRLHKHSLSRNYQKMQAAVEAVIEKHFGPNDRNFKHWPQDKKRAWGGVYRYYTLTSIQGGNDWTAAGHYLRQGLQCDPTLASDLDLFYEMAHGTQPLIYRGTRQELDLTNNVRRIEDLLKYTFDQNPVDFTPGTKKMAFGTAYLALGLISYSLNERRLSRNFFLNALRYWPELILTSRISSSVFKTYIPSPALEMIKKYLPGISKARVEG